MKLTLFILLIHFPGLIVHNSSVYVILEKKKMAVFVLFLKNVLLNADPILGDITYPFQAIRSSHLAPFSK